MAARVEAAGWRGCERMVASSRILIGAPHLALDAVNPGRLVYGLLEPPWNARVDARCALAAREGADDLAASASPPAPRRATRRRRCVATRWSPSIPFGFADGYPRLPGRRHRARARRRAPLVGPRHTEHAMVDVTDVPGVALGDEVVLLGDAGQTTRSRSTRSSRPPASR